MKRWMAALLVAILLAASSCAVLPQADGDRGYGERDYRCPRGYPEGYFSNRPDYDCRP